MQPCSKAVEGNSLEQKSTVFLYIAMKNVKMNVIPFVVLKRIRYFRLRLNLKVQGVKFHRRKLKRQDSPLFIDAELTW